MISYNEVVFLSVPVLSILFELLFVSLILLIDGRVTSILAALPRSMRVAWFSLHRVLHRWQGVVLRGSLSAFVEWLCCYFRL